MDKYKQATKEEVINLIKTFNENTEDGRISLNEIAKQAYCEAICNGVLTLNENDQWDRLGTVYAKFNGNVMQVDDSFSILTAPRILGGELDLEQCREVYGYVKTELDQFNEFAD